MFRMLSSLAVVVGLSCAAFADPALLYVATNGNDAWSGTLAAPNAANSDGPFASLERARDAIRAMKQAGPLPEGGVIVTVAGGTYSRTRVLELTADDSGDVGAPVIYRAAPGEEVRLVGGTLVTGFTPVTDAAVLERLDPAVHGKVVQADLKALGVTDFGSASGGGLEVFFKNDPMRICRWPNDDFVRIVDIVEDDGHAIHGHKGSKVGKFVFDGDRPARWIGEKDPWLHGYWFWDWSDQRHQVESIDMDNHILAVKPPYHNYGYRKNQWYYAFNMLSELDAPGEWYLDRETGILYFLPPAPIDSGETLVSVLPHLITMADTSHVTLRGFTLEASRGHAVTMKDGTCNTVAACIIRNTGSWAVTVSNGTRHGVVGCDIYQTAGGGISLTGGDRTSLTPGNHYAENNHIHHYARIKRVYNPGITLQGVGNRAAHNLIHNAPHMAMGFGGNDHVIEFNEIHSVCYESNDAGAIYTGRNWTMRGNLVRYNYMHHVNGFEARGCVGVYLDDMFSSADIVGNVFYKVTRAAFIGGGRDCSVVNNIFVDCDPSLHIDSRALGWAHGHADGWIKEAQEKGTLSGIAYNKPPYSERYPKLVNIIEDEPKAPKGNLIARNVSWGGRWDGVQKSAKPYQTFEDNLIDVDPHFVDAANQDFRLKPDSPAFELGFKPIPIDQIGLYDDPDRASWPVSHTVRPSQ